MADGLKCLHLNIFIKTSHLFGLKQTNLCNSPKQFLLTAAEAHKYINSTEKENPPKKNTHAMNMHGTHGCAHGLPKPGGRGAYGLCKNFCTVRGETQKYSLVSLDFTVNYAGRTVFIYQTDTKRTSIKFTEWIYNSNLQYLQCLIWRASPTNSKNLIPIRLHAHLINTCSSKFGATTWLKNVHLKQKCHSYYVHIIIIHYKHWLYDSTTPIWLYTPRINVLFLFLTVTQPWQVTYPHQVRGVFIFV